MASFLNFHYSIYIYIDFFFFNILHYLKLGFSIEFECVFFLFLKQMDRTSILGDTIDYMKELLERIKILRGEIDEMGNSNSSSSSSNQLNLMDIFKDLKSKEIIIRNTPKV